MNFKNRIDYLLEHENLKEITWYTPKHEWSIIDLCYSAFILEKFKEYNKIGEKVGLVQFYKQQSETLQKGIDSHKLTATSRIVPNAVYIGLVKGVYSKNLEREIADPFFEIQKRCDGNFEKVEMYYDIFEQQVEKMFVNRKREESEVLLHPLFVLYKVLLLAYEYTERFAISKDEFYAFVYSTHNYDDVYQCIEYIVKSRINHLEEVKKIRGKVSEVRIFGLFNQIKSLEVTSDSIKIRDEYVEDIKKKIHKYENIITKRYDRQLFKEALYSKMSIFEYFKEESYE
ncbi:hypothetical protein [Jeotgalicoccus psychrophilus]|uniref:hypothetical protein n=1 Tax=Jeotgalicoccus psychrophilus TaxID=157228 RepID=UPI0003FDC986|nr:hypothetical protein [Jeotgalicoccus psychrophilus]